MDEHAMGVVLQRLVEVFNLPIAPHCVCFALDGLDAIGLAKIVELPLEFCAMVVYYGVWLANLLYVDLKSV